MTEFKLPITYLENKYCINKNIVDDLELLHVNGDSESRYSLLQTIYNPKSKIGKLNLNMHSEYFTNNKLFLKETQKLIREWKNDDDIENKQNIYDEFYELWQNMKNDEHFADRYYYIDVNYFKFLNNSGPFLQVLSIYNLLSPIITLTIPIILLIVPFFMLKFNGVKINMETYYRVLKDIFSKHALGNIGNIIGNVSWEKRIYGLISFAFYLFSVYQNSLVCYRFYKNLYSIHNSLYLFNKYLTITIDNISILEHKISTYKTYEPFLATLQYNKSHYLQLKVNLDRIQPFSIINMARKSCEIGNVMKYFYEMHTNEPLKQSIEYSIGLNAYTEHMNGLQLLCREKLINKCNFGKNMKMTQTFYPFMLHELPIKNDIELKKNMIITGPNASGKTTILKTILFNQVFSQTTGYGFYSKATLPLYHNIHCYLNIPDTSGRDSLFQAEARRCKEIMDSLGNKQKHFCIFDELFSGTNPHEASSSSYGFIKYLNNIPNIDYVLTTHLTDICHKLDAEIINRNMHVKQIDDFNFEYTYNIIDGISSIKGGLKVLSDLQYPDVILTDSVKYMKYQ